MKNNILIAGMDEAGRGPAIGPLVFGIVILSRKQEMKLKQFGIKDSKTLTHQKRVEMKTIIEKNCEFSETFMIKAKEIDEFRAKGTNLNQIEIYGFRKLLTPMAHKVNVLQLDAADVNEERFGRNFNDLIKGTIISKHKGDSIYISVGAASILAKVKRDLEIEKLQQKMKNFDPTLPSFGSGYPTSAKPFLEAYVQKYDELPDIARKSWNTCEKILQQFTGFKQVSLEDW